MSFTMIVLEDGMTNLETTIILMENLMINLNLPVKKVLAMAHGVLMKISLKNNLVPALKSKKNLRNNQF